MCILLLEEVYYGLFFACFGAEQKAASLLHSPYMLVLLKLKHKVRVTWS